MNNKLGIIHIIDSFFPGGSERMSVNFSNSLSSFRDIDVHLCATRRGGKLEKLIKKDVSWFILNKKSTFDFFSFYRLFKYIKNNNIKLIHAHSSSFFIALILKMFLDIKIVWHVHYGKLINTKPSYLMKVASSFFDYTIVVNNELYTWCNKELKICHSKLRYLQNFPDLDFSESILNLPGNDGKRLVLVANLRDEKDFLTLVKSIELLIVDFPDWSLLIVGKDYKDEYSENIHKYIVENKLIKNIFFLGQCDNIGAILRRCQIGIISSKTEGLPVSLLEYGLAKLAVVSTDVGECSKVLNNGEYGALIQKENPEELYLSLKRIILDSSLMNKYSKSFNAHIIKEYSKKKISEDLKFIYKDLI